MTNERAPDAETSAFGNRSRSPKRLLQGALGRWVPSERSQSPITAGTRRGGATRAWPLAASAAAAILLAVGCSAPSPRSAFERGNPTYHWSTDMTPITVYRGQCTPGDQDWDRCIEAPRMPGYDGEDDCLPPPPGKKRWRECESRWRQAWSIPRAYILNSSTVPRDGRTWWQKLRGAPGPGEWPESIRSDLLLLHMGCTPEGECMPRPIYYRTVEATKRERRIAHTEVSVGRTNEAWSKAFSDYLRQSSIDRGHMILVEETSDEGYETYHRFQPDGSPWEETVVSRSERASGFSEITCKDYMGELWFCPVRSYIRYGGDRMFMGRYEGESLPTDSHLVISHFVQPGALGGLDGTHDRLIAINDALCMFLDCAREEGEAR